MSRIVIVTPAFTQWNHGYSLTSVVEDQARMLSRHGHSVVIAVADNFIAPVESYPFSFLPIIPILEEAADYRSYSSLVNAKQHVDVADSFSRVLNENIKPDDTIFTHDVVYTGWNLPYFHGLRNSGIKNNCYHWIHSIPTQQFDWWNLSSLGPNHRLVIPNRAHRQLTAEVYQTVFDNVLYIPHIRDIREFLDFGEDAWKFIDKYPRVLQADIVQVYPASSDRLLHKGLKDLIYLFREFKKRGFSVCLVIANQWATGRQRMEDLQEYLDTASNNGLIPEHEFIFTSTYDVPRFELGLPRKFLRDLLSLSNLFVFPTAAESFGLVLPEVLLSSGALPVVNSHLEVMSEILAGRGMRFGFGSFTNGLAKPHSAGWYEAVASAISQRIFDEESVACRSIIRQTYNMDNIYRKYYYSLVRSIDYDNESDGEDSIGKDSSKNS